MTEWSIRVGQVYRSPADREGAFREIKILKFDSRYYLGPSVFVENTEGPKRSRWVSAYKLHDNENRRTGYRYVREGESK